MTEKEDNSMEIVVKTWLINIEKIEKSLNTDSSRTDVEKFYHFKFKKKKSNFINFIKYVFIFLELNPRNNNVERDF